MIAYLICNPYNYLYETVKSGAIVPVVTIVSPVVKATSNINEPDRLRVFITPITVPEPVVLSQMVAVEATVPRVLTLTLWSVPEPDFRVVVAAVEM